MSGSDTHRAAEQAARQSYGKLVAFLAARSRDVAAAEDALADAFAAALATWPQQGVPDSPEAWLLTAARRRLTDAARRRQTAEGAVDHLLLLLDEAKAGDGEDGVPDWRLRLMFACAHPAIHEAARAPLMLQAVLGLDAAAIAAAFLVPPATMGQRLVRAKRRIRETGISFRIPNAADLPDRVDAVLDAIYATFGAGWLDPAGLDVRRQGLADEAIWLGRVLVARLPDEPEALGLLALMLHAGARRQARRGRDGAYAPLSEQDPAAWDGAAIDEAERLLGEASRLGRLGRFQLEAAVQSVHAARRHTGRTDWPALVELYDGLMALAGSPVVAVNRAAALIGAGRLDEATASLERLGEDGRMAGYQPYWATRADLHARQGDRVAAQAAYGRAIDLEGDPAVRGFLMQRRAGF